MAMKTVNPRDMAKADHNDVCWSYWDNEQRDTTCSRPSQGNLTKREKEA
jgi:hypothetical protein